MSFSSALQSSLRSVCEQLLTSTPHREKQLQSLLEEGLREKILLQSSWDAMENVGQVKAGFELITLPFPPNAFH